VVKGALTNLGIEPTPKVDLIINYDKNRHYPAV